MPLEDKTTVMLDRFISHLRNCIQEFEKKKSECELVDSAIRDKQRELTQVCADVKAQSERLDALAKRTKAMGAA